METGNQGEPLADDSARWVVRMPGARLVTIKVAAKQTGGAYTLLEVEVRPGGGEWPHIQHREDECLYVVEGEFDLLDEDRTLRAGPGSLMYVPKGSLHAYENAGDTTGKLLILHTPGGAHERFLEEVGEPTVDPATDPAGRPMDPASLIRIAQEHGIEAVPPIPHSTASWAARGSSSSSGASTLGLTVEQKALERRQPQGAALSR